MRLGRRKNACRVSTRRRVSRQSCFSPIHHFCVYSTSKLTAGTPVFGVKASQVRRVALLYHINRPAYPKQSPDRWSPFHLLPFLCLSRPKHQYAFLYSQRLLFDCYVGSIAVEPSCTNSFAPECSTKEKTVVFIRCEQVVPMGVRHMQRDSLFKERCYLP